MAKSIPLFLLFLSFFFLIATALLPSHTILDAVEILSDSGFVAMSLTLQLVSQTLTTQSSALTIFAPADSAFRDSGQPSLTLLQYHFSPIKFSLETLSSLPYGTKIPTLFTNHTLIVTTLPSDEQISINNITINGSAIFDVGSLAVYGIGNFFDPAFDSVKSPSLYPPVQSPMSNSECSVPKSSSLSSDFTAKALNPLKSRGYSVFASFLELQLPWIRDQTKLTVFAPSDEEMNQHLRNSSEFSSIFHRHVVPCRLTSIDLLNLDEEETILETVLDGFSIKVTLSGDVLVLNGVPVIFPDVYSSDSFVVHGLQQMLPLQAEQEELVQDTFSEFHGDGSDESAMDYGEF